ncbi:MAG TPA: alkaline phosphatase family protein [Polyangiales bacterium]|nr:alkaline phosphatase family protein [Polyangiales bacterium]
MAGTRRVLMIGLDCAAPELVFERYRDALPNLSRLMREGAWGRLRSTLPPITVPAWASMFSGRDPGELGLYGFRNRERGSYALRIADSSDVRVPMVWNRAGDAGKHVSVLFAPPSFPPRAVNGELVSCFLTPSAEEPHTHPAALADELSARFGPYRPDVDDYRTDELARLKSELYELTAQHFAIAEHVLRTRKPELLVMVEIGLDRFHHAFWSLIDERDPRHVPGNAFANAGREYYAFLDARVGALVAAARETLAPGDELCVLVASDHGARPLAGGICINEWLIEHGYLVLHEYPERVTPFDALRVDWSRTRVWGEGGYYGRVFFNVRGREPQGCVAESDIAALRAQLKRELAGVRGPKGEALTHRIVAPDECYRRCEGLPPDLAVFFGDLAYRALGSVGHRALHAANNDTGPDACNHDWDGMFVLHAPSCVRVRGELSGLQIQDVGATILGLMGVAGEADLLGRDWSRA